MNCYKSCKLPHWLVIVCHNDWIKHICEKQKVGANELLFFHSIQLQTLWQWVQQPKEMWCYGQTSHMKIKPWLQNPWRSSWLKKRIWICPTCLESIVSCPYSLFKILTFKIYLHYNDVRTYNVLIKFDVIHKTMLWEWMNILVANMTMIYNHLMEMDVNVNVSKTPLQSPCLSL